MDARSCSAASTRSARTLRQGVASASRAGCGRSGWSASSGRPAHLVRGPISRGHGGIEIGEDGLGAVEVRLEERHCTVGVVGECGVEQALVFAGDVAVHLPRARTGPGSVHVRREGQPGADVEEHRVAAGLASILSTAFGPLLVGIGYDVLGSYAGVMPFLAGALVLCAVAFSLLGPYRYPAVHGFDDAAARDELGAAEELARLARTEQGSAAGPDSVGDAVEAHRVKR